VNDRPTASTINDQQLDELHDALDGAYRERAQLLALLAALHPSVIAPAPDVDEPGWQILYLRIGGRQASWHIAPRDAELYAHVEHVPTDDRRAQWDGHSTEEKYAHIGEQAARLYADACARVETMLTPEPAATAWAPPPPGDRREQLPDHLRALIHIPSYLSTACETGQLLAWEMPKYTHYRVELGDHSDRLHARCRINNKFTGALCHCPCHDDAPEPAATQATDDTSCPRTTPNNPTTSSNASKEPTP
jgi:hypothetical protein